MSHPYVLQLRLLFLCDSAIEFVFPHILQLRLLSIALSRSDAAPSRDLGAGNNTLCEHRHQGATPLALARRHSSVATFDAMATFDVNLKRRAVEEHATLPRGGGGLHLLSFHLGRQPRGQY